MPHDQGRGGVCGRLQARLDGTRADATASFALPLPLLFVCKGLSSRPRRCAQELVFSWARGTSFAELMRSTKVFEGSVIRALRREEELLRQLGAGAAGVGEAALGAKFEAAAALLRRDVVFAASLFL